MRLYFFPGLPAGEKEKMAFGFCSQHITRCTTKVPAVGTDVTPSSISLVVPFSKGGCMAVGAASFLEIPYCWLMDGVSLRLECFMQPGGLITSEFLEVFFLLVVANGCFFTSLETKITCCDCSLCLLYSFCEKTDLSLTYATNWVWSGNKSAYQRLAASWGLVILLHGL